VFCDGDFWHGKDLQSRLASLRKGHNAGYWEAKIRRNVERDRERTTSLANQGWTVLRIWESDIKADVSAAADRVVQALQRNRGP
jgi:DNA mismatch endonuclease (patch repair protein)